jgi:glycine cleavage system aminomethyltransferase T
MLKRKSPVDMRLKPERVLERDGWEIALSYVGEMKRNDLFIADLSHAPKWTVQGPDLDSMRPAGLSMPGRSRMAVFSKGTLIARLHASEARILVFDREAPPLTDPCITDVTDGSAALAVVGPRCYGLLSKLSAVDLGKDPAPSAALAPVEDVTCLIVQAVGQGGIPGLIIAGARGYGHFLFDAILDAGREYGIEVAGWERFQTWFNARG